MKVLGKVASFLIAFLLLASILLPARTVQAATGFRISGRNLLDANGKNFIMRGISHPHVWYTSQTSSFANIKAAGANTVRVVFGGGRWGSSSASDVASVIQLCKTNKYTETGDYSFDPARLSFVDWDHVTLYRNGVLIWGTEL